ncbi:MAG: glycosyltransferase, partial [Myxococcales bacterium]|nr:glycosyltransferase [Myxococcales bacterium]
MPYEVPELSVLIPTFERESCLWTLLDGLARQSYDARRFEVVVVDDGSRTPPKVDLDSLPYSIQPLRQENGGPASARNRGLAECRAPLVLILNDDALPDPELVATHLQAHANAPKNTAVLGSFRFSESALKSPFVQILDSSDLLFNFPALRHGEHHDWTFFWTCNLSLSVSAIREVGGFDDERFREAICEDVELGYRLERCGFSVVYREDAICHHDHVLTPASYFRRQESWTRNMIRFREKHGDVLPGLSILLGKTDERDACSMQLQFEAFRAFAERGTGTLERLERECAGRVLDAELRNQLIPVVRQISAHHILRQALEIRNGVDPELRIREGPNEGELTSVIVVSRDGLADSKACLEALRSSTDPRHPTEIIWVDNGSTDGSVSFLEEQDDLVLICNPDNRGAPAARNQGLALAQGRWLVFLDNDAVVSPGWLERLRWHAAADPLVGCVCPVSNRAAHGQQIEYGGGSDFSSTREFARLRAQEFSEQAKYQHIFTSFCVMVRREVIEAIGGFDERFSPWGFEDDDFSLRACLAGFRNRLALDVFVRHG